ncbi:MULTISPECIES: hypothetical protein [unclassified Streptomyces]|uniref:hypothetical protein n=1 Tax=unclassified Streptomyces TaxID=2593676 RepID=UPI0006F78E3C|nr:MULTISPECIES: hypothetical protein [unclassified Streptomyces]KQX47924.1 hypothetical protein ASD33_19550 [Streptomyces sp. Root1304]KRA82315.1 hypothetical protein ASE09_14505 [Streptomyces sp. Root66D1]
MTARSDRRWAELARDLEFSQLPELRRQAEGWRTGLAGLTALLGVLTVVKGQDQLSGLPDATARWAAALVLSAFVVLVCGALLAVRASHGRPEREIVLGGQALRRWTSEEVRRVRHRLRWAAVCGVAGPALAVAATCVVWSATPAPAPYTVRLSTPYEELCGELVGADPHGTAIRTGRGAAKTLRVVPHTALVSLAPVSGC